MKVAFYTLGCKLNQAETESLITQFSEAGFQIVAPHDIADIYVANTCTVTHIADRKSRHWLRLMRRRNPEALIIATGCYAQRAPQELTPIADLVLGNDGKGHLLDIVKGSLSFPFVGTSPSPLVILRERSDRRISSSLCSELWLTRINSARQSYSSRVRSLIKIQDGCHSPCTYCIVPQVRPQEYSLPTSEIIEEVKRKTALGYKEVVLTGTKIGCYRDGNITLGDLVRCILDNTDIERLRLSSLQPQELSAKFLALWQDTVLSRSSEPFASCHSERSEESHTAQGKLRKGEESYIAQDGLREGTSEGPRLCRHFHLALQSGSDAVLQRMRRRYSLNNYQRTLNLIREAIPGVAITTDIIVGFPGESDEEFEQSYKFCRQAGFANIHVFPFSARPGTLAASMPEQIDESVKKERKQKMLELAQYCRQSFCQQFLGQTMGVLWEKEVNPGSGIYSGLTDNYIRVFVRSEKSLSNKLTPARLLGFHNQGIWGELVGEDSG